MTANLDPETKRQLARAGRHLALAQQHLGPEMRNASAPVLACWDDLNHTAVALGAAGVVVDVEPERVAPATDSLEHLRRIEESRTEGLLLLSALDVLVPIAERLDKRRGNWVGDMADIASGETPGTNYAETIQELHLKLRMELYGARGARRE